MPFIANRQSCRALTGAALLAVLGVASAEAKTPAPPLVPQPQALSSQGQDTEQDSAKMAAVTARAEARWQALINGDLDAAYGFEAPGYRSAVSPESFKSRFGSAAAWKDAKVSQVEILPNGQAARVVLSLTYEPRLPTGAEFGVTTRPIKEAWLLKKGQWWHVSD